jgi:exosortase B
MPDTRLGGGGDALTDLQGSALERIVPWLLLLTGLCVLYVPTFVDLFRTLWSTSQNAHGPIVLAIAAWAFYHGATKIAQSPPATVRSAPWLGGAVLAFGLLCYVAGRSQSFYILEVGSIIPLLVGLVLVLWGPEICRRLWFPFFFLCFMIPLPGSVIDTLTQPLKIVASYGAEQILYWLGYPIARAGVVLHVGQYQLLVADACAGLNSLFTLESMGLLYMNVMGYQSVARNVALAIFIVPISMAANIIRVVTLALVTYYFGDEAGQGFVHDFSGILLFLTALMLIMATDSLLGPFFSNRRKTRAERSKG